MRFVFSVFRLVCRVELQRATTLGFGGLPTKFPSSPQSDSLNPRFRKAPLSSRTVGFPESGWRQQHFPEGPSQTSRGLSTRLHTPLGCMIIPPARHPLRLSPFPWHSVQMVFPIWCPPLTESPFARSRCYLLRRDV